MSERKTTAIYKKSTEIFFSSVGAKNRTGRILQIVNGGLAMLEWIDDLLLDMALICGVVSLAGLVGAGAFEVGRLWRGRSE